MQKHEFLERYQQGERNFAYIDLSGASLSGLNLKEIDLTGANLTGANLSWTVLTQATLTGACLRRADLHNVLLTSANLNQANLSGANLTKVDLRFALLKEVDLNWAILQEADLSGADLSGAKLDQVNLEQAKLNNAKLIGAEVMEANLSRASLMGTNLTGANLREAHLGAANLRQAILTRANLTEADLSGVMLRGANLNEADLHRVILTGADLTEAQLNSADLSRANLTGAYLLKASFKKAYLLRTNLQEVYLLWANLTEANLRGANLRRADLSGAYLEDAMLGEADLRDALLVESHLIRTNLEAAKLTGCCIHNWEISDVELAKTECDYVFTHFDYTAKKPTNRYPKDRIFLPGEFGSQKQEDSALIEVEFSEVVNWEGLVFTLAQVELESYDLKLKIESFETLTDKSVLRIKANNIINTKILGEQVLFVYPKMLERLEKKRQEILGLLNLRSPTPAPSSSPTSSVKVASVPEEAEPLFPQQSVNQKQQALHQEVSRQIRSLLLSQEPEKFILSVQRLLDYLEKQGVTTQEIQHQVIIQGIVQRAKQDAIFRENLLRWEKTAKATERISLMGELVRFAIALLWEES